MDDIYSDMYIQDARRAAQSVISPEFFQGKTVAVFGASGFIGSTVCFTLCELGARVIACGRSEERLKNLFAHTSSVRTVKVDINDASWSTDTTIQDLYGTPDIVIDAASPADPASFAQFPVRTMLSNVEGLSHVLDYVVAHNVERTLYISSGEIYGYFMQEHRVKEEEQGVLDILSARSCYPQSKRAAETLCASYATQYGIDVRIARPSHVIGPQFRASDSRASAQFFRDALAGRDISLTSTGEQIRTFAYIADCVSGILSIISRGEPCHAYNVTNSENMVTFAQFARKIGQCAGINVHIPAHTTDTASRAELKRLAQLDDSKLRSLGWSPQFGFDETIERTFTFLERARSVED
ncbi:NAD-dependent epimerase/dehydratase family protein [Alloscardovia venturai]|uniref:NAD-dependent epimerase/dehydratase family protein n=1 Tax=Alloscardovia venturai TaxID=1769421 RepID=A0ABW2Y9E0_9BIFI